MKSISIYALTRKQNIACLSRLEHQLSGREKPLKIRTWELNSMRAFVDHLEEHMPGRDPQAADPEPLLLIGAGETDPVLYLYQQ